MKCPNCQNEMQEVNQQGVPVGFCPSCKGMFLDEGKINYLVANPMAVNQKLAEGLINESESSRLCPKCSVPMTKGGLMDRDLEINRCPTCKGLFFDTGELPELSKLSEQGQHPARGKA